ncbi:hypothetical protein MKK63_17905 [Methylobacterium sp. J-088]|uniref:hypothetical protein n=1 Tax=unclassified Methylobacterium TaxID=2615210 RepID=UPI001FBA0C6D|nr:MULTISPECIES: hypothetical protein [unclassified Methylobacterium]MCJ2064576.1 hypothetical protein [Methylobacterium sp. J-088]
MSGLRTIRLARLVMAAGLLLGAVSTGRAAGPLAIQETRLHTPPDSHEPQRALIDLRNAGPDPVAQVTILCTFTGAGGAVLDTQTVSVPEIFGHAAVQAEAIYYGYPRASGAACRLTEPH